MSNETKRKLAQEFVLLCVAVVFGMVWTTLLGV